MLADDNPRDPSRGAIRSEHKETGKATIICVENLKGLGKAGLEVQHGHIVRHCDMDVWHEQICDVSYCNIYESSFSENGLEK